MLVGRHAGLHGVIKALGYGVNKSLNVNTSTYARGMETFWRVPSGRSPITRKRLNAQISRLHHFR